MIRPAVRISSLAIAGVLLILYMQEEQEPFAVTPTGHAAPVVVTAETDEGAWFSGVRQYCNAVEVELALRRNPPPESLRGSGYEAACLALAGKIARAREVLRDLPPDDQWRGAGVVFDVGHPVADAGDDIAAAPIMELVVEFWPNHYMALYHAGAARAALGQHPQARPYLESFLRHYDLEDGWTKQAQRLLRAGN